MKVMMPKEMKIRLVANVLATVLGFCNAGIAAWLLVEFLADVQDITGLLAVFLLVAAAGLTFVLAKVAWALKKQVKKAGKLVLAITAVLVVLGVMPFMAAGFPMFTLESTGWSILVIALSLLGGLLMVAGRLVGEMIEKLRFLFHAGLGCMAGLAVVLVIIGSMDLTSVANAYSAMLALLVIVSLSCIASVLGYWAEAKLIKMKFLVYN